MHRTKKHACILKVRFVASYAVYLAVSNLFWEVAQLPLYGIWFEDTAHEIAYAAVHCTGGDVLIGLSSLGLAVFLNLLLTRPAELNLIVVGSAVIFGVVYTLFSEWLNVYVRKSWSYSQFMPLVDIGDISIGLSPVLQWMVLPTLFLMFRYLRD